MYKKRRVNSNSRIISTDEDPSLRIESSAIINLRGVSTKLNKYIIVLFFLHTRGICDTLTKAVPVAILVPLFNQYSVLNQISKT